MFLIFDTETTGLPKDFSAPISDVENWPRCIQLAWQLHDFNGDLIEIKNYIIYPEGFSIPYNSQKIHGISTERAKIEGHPIKTVLSEFNNALSKSQYIVGHNISFDVNIIFSEFYRANNLFKIYKIDKRELEISNDHNKWKTLDTMSENSANFCEIPGGRFGKFKFPKLTELHAKLFGNEFSEAHNASVDVAATARCFFELVRLGVIDSNKFLTEDQKKIFFDKNKKIIPEFEPILNIVNDNQNHEFESNIKVENKQKIKEINNELNNSFFIHLHCHSSFSILQSTISIENLVNEAVKNNMKAVALTDIGNLFGAFKFVKTCQKNNIKPILGCEFFITEDHKKRSFTREKKDKRYSQIIYAKNLNGYKNLSKLSSQAYIDGLYSGFPRIDKDLLLSLKEDLIVVSSGIKGEIANVLLNEGEEKAKKLFIWWKENFKSDFYIQLSRHNLDDETYINKILISWCKEHAVKYFCSNEIYYLNKEDHDPHDILLCIKNGELKETPVGYGRGFRYGLPSNEYFFKNTQEMYDLFNDIPEVFGTCEEIYKKIEFFDLERKVSLPIFNLPDSFSNQNEYLKFLTLEGAKKRYGVISQDLEERILFELETIKKTGYPGYFLIVQDITKKAREMGVIVGPGRGSAAGSVVAYSIGITNVDPIKYGLLFERFLNPDRVSLPDIDIDFDDEGRSKLISWVVKKYGLNQVAQIITFGTMAAKSSIRDVGRVLNLELSKTDRIAKLIPSNIKLKEIIIPQDGNINLKDKLNRDQLYNVSQIQKILKNNDLESQVLKTASLLEGSIRNIGTHACGMIITPKDMREIVPVAISSNSLKIQDNDIELQLPTTQFDNSVVENAGLLKMDFLGLKTLSIISDAIKLIKERHSVSIEIDNIPLNDKKTYELYQKGQTNGTFQFESSGMQRYLRLLKPDKFEDLIAMNALYRPGPLEYIPKFIARKNGSEKINYDLAEQEEFLYDTYGITVYQEQVMLLSQKLANFSKGDADVLRKAMGKKNKILLDQLKTKFIEGCKKNGHKTEIVNKIWTDWESFAAYAFNKSHSTCYSVLAFQTAYLKANYPSEYMASVLTHNLNDITKLSFYLEECKTMGISILGPDVNESNMRYSVNKQGNIRFGLGAIKGVGSSAAEFIINERKNKGPYNDLFDFFTRMNSRSTNKKAFESLIMGGAFDKLTSGNRSIFYNIDERKQMSFLEILIKFSSLYRQSLNAPVLFSSDDSIEKPKIPVCESFTLLKKLKQEKEVLGMYVSGHPLDNYYDKIKYRCNCQIIQLNDLKKFENKKIVIGGMVTDFHERETKNGKKYGVMSIEDFSSTREFRIFKDYDKLSKSFFEIGSFLEIHISIQKNYYNDDLSINIIKMMDLDRSWNCITFKISVEEVNEEFINNLENVLNNNKGKTNFEMHLHHTKKNIFLPFKSNIHSIKYSKKFLKEMKEIGIYDYFLN